jgi:hypothetical protein
MNRIKYNHYKPTMKLMVINGKVKLVKKEKK